MRGLDEISWLNSQFNSFPNLLLNKIRVCYLQVKSPSSHHLLGDFRRASGLAHMMAQATVLTKSDASGTTFPTLPIIVHLRSAGCVPNNQTESPVTNNWADRVA